MTLAMGMAKVDVSPPPNPEGTLDVPILGFWWERAKAYLEIHDPLCARAAAFRSDGHTVALVAVDMIGDAIGFGREARERAARRLGLLPEQIMVACTHAHTTPETIGLCNRVVADAWREHLVEGIVRALDLAVGNLQPVRLRTAVGSLEGVCMNRRAPLVAEADPSLLARLTPDQKRRAQDLDTTLRVAWAETPAGEPVGALVHFACHPVAVQTMPLISADYPGYAMSRLERDGCLGPVCLFTNGPAGDVNPARRNGFDDVAWTGDRLVDETHRLVREARSGSPAPTSDGPAGIAWASHTVRVPRRRVPPREELERQKEALAPQVAAAGPMDLDRPYLHPAFQSYLVDEQRTLGGLPPELDAEVQVLRIGDWLVAGVPGELVTCLGQDIRQAASPLPTWVIGYANGYLGYIAPKEAHLLGGYETSAGRWSPLAPGAAETLRDVAIGLTTQVL